MKRLRVVPECCYQNHPLNLQLTIGKRCCVDYSTSHIPSYGLFETPSCFVPSESTLWNLSEPGMEAQRTFVCAISMHCMAGFMYVFLLIDAVPYLIISRKSSFHSQC